MKIKVFVAICAHNGAVDPFLAKWNLHKIGGLYVMPKPFDSERYCQLLEVKNKLKVNGFFIHSHDVGIDSFDDDLFDVCYVDHSLALRERVLVCNRNIEEFLETSEPEITQLSDLVVDQIERRSAVDYLNGFPAGVCVDNVMGHEVNQLIANAKPIVGFLDPSPDQKFDLVICRIIDGDYAHSRLQCGDAEHLIDALTVIAQANKQFINLRDYHEGSSFYSPKSPHFNQFGKEYCSLLYLVEGQHFLMVEHYPSGAHCVTHLYDKRVSPDQTVKMFREKFAPNRLELNDEFLNYYKPIAV